RLEAGHGGIPAPATGWTSSLWRGHSRCILSARTKSREVAVAGSARRSARGAAPQTGRNSCAGTMDFRIGNRLVGADCAGLIDDVIAKRFLRMNARLQLEPSVFFW